MKKYKKHNRKKAFTLLELLMAITLTSIIASTIVYVLKAGLDAWQYGQGQALCQLGAETAVDRIVEGDFFYDGLREALEITKATPQEIHFIPWYVQLMDKVVPGEKYQLAVPFLKGTSSPIGEVYNEKKKEFEFRNLQYFRDVQGSSSKEYVRFEIKKAYKKARVIYYPDPRKAPETIMQIAFNPAENMIFRTYMGNTKALFRGEKNISDLQFRYFDSSNTVLKEENIKKFNVDHFKKTLTTPITAIEVNVTCESGGETYLLNSFVNMRKKGIAGSGIYLTEGAKVGIPNSKEVKVLNLINFGGIDGESKVELVIKDEANGSSEYLLRLKFDNINGVEYLNSYTVEYPKGEAVLTKELNRPANSGVSFMALDPSGHYDYDDDESIEDYVAFEGENIVLTVEKMEIGGMNLFVR